MSKKAPAQDPMPPIIFSYKEVVEALLKHRRIKEGIWSLRLEFALGAGNMPGPDGTLTPAAIVPVTSLGLQPSNAVNHISVDASDIHSSTSTKTTRPQKKKPGASKKTKA